MDRAQVFRPLVVAVFLALLAFESQALWADPPRAESGVLDLRGRSLRSESVPLNGAWEFYWRRFILPGAFGTEQAEQIQVPLPWNQSPAKTYPTEGYATYRLLVLVNPGTESLALRIGDICTSARLFVNGEQVYASGRVGTTRESVAPAYRSKVVQLAPARDGRLELVLHVANFHFRLGGIRFPLALGDAELVNAERERSLLIEVFLCGVLLFMGLYHLVLFAYRPRAVAPLFFGVFCLLVALRMLLTGERYFLHLFPGVPFEWFYKFEFLTFFLGIPFWILFVYSLYPEEFSERVARVFAWLGVVLLLVVVIFPVRDYSRVLLGVHLITVVGGLYTMFAIFRAVRHGRKGARTFLAGWAVLFVVIVYDILLSRGIIEGFALLPVGMLFFFGTQAILLARRFSSAFVTAEQLTANLEDEVLARTRELQTARDEAERSTRAKSEFLSVMSHEIRTPMHALVGTADLLADSGLEESQQKYLRVLKRAGSQLVNIVNDILDFSRIEADKLELNPSVFRLHEYLRELLTVLEVRALRKDLRLELKINEDVPDLVRGDPGRLEQILVNLIGNAIKFTEKGFVQVRCSRVPQSDQANSMTVEFIVEDSGVGISAGPEVDIFDSFSQADSSVSRNFGGTGLGLAISRQLVELMGGEIWYQSEPGVGSIFRFTVEFSAPSAGSEEVPRTEAIPVVSVAGARILLVDDNEDNQFLIESFLNGSGVRLRQAWGGAEAVEILGNESFDLVFMDIQMPGMDGYTATRLVREREQERGSPRTPIIALSANAAPEDINRSLFAGCDRHITKPLGKQLLLETISAVVAGRTEQ